VIVRQLNKDREFEMNREVGIHKWTPLYRAGKKKTCSNLILKKKRF
jgi:hypothetical protein